MPDVKKEIANPPRTAKSHLWLGPCPVITYRPIDLESCSNSLKKQKVS